MERAVSDSEAPRRFNTALISAFAHCSGVAGGARYLQRHRVFGGAAGAGDGHPHGSGIAKIEDFEAGLYVCGKACHRRLRHRTNGRRGRFACVAIVSCSG